VQHLPPVDEAFAKALGIGGGTVEALRADVRKTSNARSSSGSRRATSRA